MPTGRKIFVYFVAHKIQGQECKTKELEGADQIEGQGRPSIFVPLLQKDGIPGGMGWC